MRVKLIGFISLSRGSAAFLFIEETKRFWYCFIKVSLRVVTFCLQCWEQALSLRNKNKLAKVSKIGSKITG